MREAYRCRSLEEYLAIANAPASATRYAFEQELLREVTRSPRHEPSGHCGACERSSRFQVPHDARTPRVDGILRVNLRESLVCRRCGLNTRQRVVAGEIRALLRARSRGQGKMAVYAMEQVTPFHRWLAKNRSGIGLVGSEFLGPGLVAGATYRGLRHEDATCLSFAAESFDCVVSNDVLEHVPQPLDVLEEVHRILRPGGVALMTFPFLGNERDTRVRARRLPSGSIEHVLEAAYHGNPVSAEGSLVYHEFGWDVLAMMRSAGLEDPHVLVVWSSDELYVGGPQILHVASKHGSPPRA